MNKVLLSFITIAGAGFILSGCGKSDSSGSAAAGNEKTASAPATAADSGQPASQQPPAASPVVAAPPAVSTPAAAQVAASTASTAAVEALPVVSQVAKMAEAQTDKVLGSITTDLVGKAKALVQSPGVTDVVKSQLNNSLTALVSGKDSQVLSSVYEQVKASALTPAQLQLAKEVANLGSAFVVQKNFATLDGAQGDVATIVNSLRKGEITPAVPSIQKVLQNVNLTPGQKDLISSVANQYAPGVLKAAGSLQQGLQTIEKLPGLGK